MKNIFKSSLIFTLAVMLIMSVFTLGILASEETTAAETTAAAEDLVTEEETATQAEETTAEETEAVNDAFASMNIDPANFIGNLSYMGLGMLGIFVVIGLVMIMTFILNKAFSGKKNDDEQ